MLQSTCFRTQIKCVCIHMCMYACVSVPVPVSVAVWAYVLALLWFSFVHSISRNFRNDQSRFNVQAPYRLWRLTKPWKMPLGRVKSLLPDRNLQRDKRKNSVHLLKSALSWNAVIMRAAFDYGESRLVSIFSVFYFHTLFGKHETLIETSLILH